MKLGQNILAEKTFKTKNSNLLLK